ncbi:PREDICTED: 17-beta-hydroxysteroid dehydrogenase 14-like [Priapulus caudatus]|uniref:17-beta-hydroxysteroid dehydrogenase 14-like n=1 Tax=Priapulus caudatus TaxID=37621 RepID=A0ABM1DXI8_PRICU|nr:PREDICTED: 17-beta-hydroxysteroid dehydrogenase 14-like [Priapulus caudatus]XP_014664659.1 PREDICTED: 17-beta-hydroxysteroid dehydrogenase 14-like [Priapulus caudatus]XP_014664660.1 PREDICTED: 17-beta-hydroxysteroid dehydrogenase 14-like [Priapulus caudatus]
MEKKVALVTGGSRGIGQGIVSVFVRNGATVVFCSEEQETSEIHHFVHMTNSEGLGICEFVTCDLTKESDIKKLVVYTVAKYSRLDCLVNNAAAHPLHMPIEGFSANDFRTLFELNVMAYFLTAKYSLAHLRKHAGNIINITSLVNQLGQKHAVTYCATKGAVTAMTKALAIDEAKYGVRVNCISPSCIWTTMFERATMSTPNPKKAINDGAAQQLVGRFGTPEEVGEAALYLATKATFCTGTDLNVTGGAELNFGIKTQVTDIN